MRKRILTTSLVVAASFAAVVLSLSGCKSSNAVSLLGAGSTFVYPVMQRWVEGFMQGHPNVRINYQSIGSGGGIQQVSADTVDFGASDVALTDAELKGMRPVIQFPESAGPVVVTYNLPQLMQPLQLSPGTLAGIYLGQITNWGDAKIAADNPGLKLPNEPIVVVHRADGSGTTNAFTTYLSAVSPEWKTKVGVGKSVSWPLGLGGKGSEGVTGQLKQAAGAIGYVELTFAEQNNLPMARIKNQSGKFVAPGTASTTAAIQAFASQLARDPRTPIVNPPATAADAYPISTMTFLIVSKDGPNKAKREALKTFLIYVVTEGQTTANELQYAPLPEPMKQYDLQQIK
ncbi:MAG: phosphate ABC transporter substrate-binding protein PstS, partial [Acidobacteriaceae bacterium]